MIFSVDGGHLAGWAVFLASLGKVWVYPLCVQASWPFVEMAADDADDGWGRRPHYAGNLNFRRRRLAEALCCLPTDGDAGKTW